MARTRREVWDGRYDHSVARLHAAPLTPHKVRLAYAVAVTADLLQLLLGPFGWAGADEVIDVVTMVLMWRMLGFHPLLLPTFALEFLPIIGSLPTWTACVA